MLEYHPQLGAIDEEADHQIVHGLVVVPVRVHPEEEETALRRRHTDSAHYRVGSRERPAARAG